MALPFSISTLVPRHKTPAPATPLAAIFESSLQAKCLYSTRNESFSSDSASQIGQIPAAATERMAYAQSLWITALNDGHDDLERESLEDIDFQANADESLLNWMDRLTDISDIVVQVDPLHVALTWAAVRLLLKLCVDQRKSLDAILDGLDIISDLINRCTFYKFGYLREDSDASKNLKKSMLLLYIEILKFFVKAADKSTDNRLQAIFTTENIADYLLKIEHLEKTVKNDADVAEAESIVSDVVAWKPSAFSQFNSDNKKLAKLVVDVYRDRKNKGPHTSRLSFSENALDKFIEAQRMRLLVALNDIMNQSNKLVEIFATTRMNPEIVSQFQIFPKIEL
ncbi:hypothetical protein BZA77DRAFT_342894 [Pyronema omphalodes]|nr:hypothetical protein BZA77DRAFT_342894 [Pyronema omphalodes]